MKVKNKWMPGRWSCAYHPSIPASETCERCRRPICSIDVKIYSQWRGHGRYRVRKRRKYCILCNAAALQRDASIEAQLSSIILFIFFAWIGFMINPLLSILVIGVAALGYFNTKSKAEKAKQEAMLFQRSLNQSRRTSRDLSTPGASMNPKEMETLPSDEHEPTIISDFVIVCFECGEKLLLTDKFCPNCGDSTQEELRAHYLKKSKSQS